MVGSLDWMAWVLLAGGLIGIARPAQADERLSPLVAMRTAAESVAEVAPEPPPYFSFKSLPKVRAASPAQPAESDKTDSFAAAVRDAVQAEMARELTAHQRQGFGLAARGGKSDGAANNGKDTRDDVRGAALQAQGAKVVGIQHSQGLAKGQGQGQEKMQMRESLGSGRGAAARGAPRAK